MSTTPRFLQTYLLIILLSLFVGDSVATVSSQSSLFNVRSISTTSIEQRRRRQQQQQQQQQQHLVRTTTAFIIGRSTASQVQIPSPDHIQCHPPQKSSRSSTHLYMGQRGKRIKKDIKKERQKEVPPRIQTPYGPIRPMRPLQTCDVCSGRGVVRCNVCEGRGVVRATGNRKRNTLPNPIQRMTGSLWTSVEIRHGHRHYRCTELRGSKKKKNLQFRMSNSCGPEEKRVHLWIDELEMKDKSSWRMGWVTLEEILEAEKGPLNDVKVCFRCKGAKVVECAACLGKGKIGFNQPLYD